MLLNTEEFQAYRSYHFSVIKGKPTGELKLHPLPQIKAIVNLLSYGKSKLIVVKNTLYIILCKKSYLFLSIHVAFSCMASVFFHFSGRSCLIRLNPIQYGYFRGCSRMGGRGWAKRPLLPKICHTYPTMKKLGTLIPYLKKIGKIYESRDTTSEFCWH